MFQIKNVDQVLFSQNILRMTIERCFDFERISNILIIEGNITTEFNNFLLIVNLRIYEICPNYTLVFGNQVFEKCYITSYSASEFSYKLNFLRYGDLPCCSTFNWKKEGF